MLIWLASFPRSGNTLARTLLRQVFDLRTHSKYEPAGSPSMDHRLTDIMGAAKYEGNFPTFLDAARHAPAVTVCKTHDEPEGDDRAIYVVRNGLVATDSYRHYLSALNGSETPWSEVLGRATAFENWSRHLDAWRPLDREGTLIVRYEDLVERPEAVIADIAGFLELRPVTGWSNPWKAVNSIGPNFFRRGLAQIPETITTAERDAFVGLHGAWMARLGYSADLPASSLRSAAR